MMAQQNARAFLACVTLALRRCLYATVLFRLRTEAQLLVVHSIRQNTFTPPGEWTLY